MSRAQDLADDRAFIRNIYIFITFVAVFMTITFYFAWSDQENFKNDLDSWNCEELKTELGNGYEQYKEQKILKKLHLEDCYS